MGSIERHAADFYGAATGAGPVCLTDYNDLTHNFIREFRFRSHGEVTPNCLFIDIEEGGDAFRLVSRQGNHSNRILRDRCRCFAGDRCAGQAEAGHPPADGHVCEVFVAPEGAVLPAEAPFDLVMSCHSISFIPNPRARCFLSNLRHRVHPGGMLFISALGRYSVLGEQYPAEYEPLATRFAPLHDNGAFHLAPESRLCLYSERDLCNTLFDAGWSVIRSATTTENNVLATAIRV